MNLRFRFLTLASLLTASTFAADAPKLPAVAAAKEKQMSGELRKPAEPTAKKKELLFSDDFERAELGKDKGWAIVVPTFSVENGALKGTQMRFDAPAKEGLRNRRNKRKNQATGSSILPYFLNQRYGRLRSEYSVCSVGHPFPRHRLARNHTARG